MSKNAKNQLLDLFKDLGYSGTHITFKPESTSISSTCRSTVSVTLHDGRKICRTGEGHCRSDAAFAAAQAVLNLLHDKYPELLVNWQVINVEAQAGDALIKLAAYFPVNSNNASNNSHLLQRIESNSHLAKVFDKWKEQNDPELAIWGPNLGKKRKATLVEALLWRRFNKQIFTVSAATELKSMIEGLNHL